MNVFCGCAIAAYRVPQKLIFGSSGSFGIASNVCCSAGDFAIFWHVILLQLLAVQPATRNRRYLFRHSPYFPNQACLWGSFSNESISARVCREGGSPVMQDRFPQRACRDLGTKISAPDLGTRILVPRSWCHSGTKIFGGTGPA